MSRQFDVSIKDFDRLVDTMRGMEKATSISASRAINRTADRARTAASRAIREDVNLSTRYVDGLLKVVERASQNSLQATVKGTQRPTSLAQFASDSVEQSHKRGGVNLEVKKGHRTFFKRAWIQKLKRGSNAISGDSFNLGLAVRWRSGGKPSRAYKPKAMGDGRWLLYAPSIDQLFKGVLEPKPGSTSRKALEQSASTWLLEEFLRQMDLNS